MVSLSVSKRDLKENNKRLRKSGTIPGVIYGDKNSTPIMVKLIEFKKVLEQAGRSHIIDLDIEGKKTLSLVKDFQIHPLTDEFIHFDLLEVDQNKEVRVSVPIEYLGTPKGVKEGGVLEILQDRVEVICKVKDIPQGITVDISELGTEASIHLSDVSLPKNTRFSQDLSTALVVIGAAASTTEDSPESEKK